MGRAKEFDPAVVVGLAARLFAESGYEGCSMDQLVRGTGVHRGSLYGTFGSKRGLFVECLKAATGASAGRDGGTGRRVDDLLLVALVELAHRDPEVRSICAAAVRDLGDDPQRRLGAAVLARAGVRTRRRTAIEEETR